MLGFAGLYEIWRNPDAAEEWVWSFTIITCTTQDSLGHIHDRSPVLVPPDLQSAWLDPGLTDPSTVSELLAGMPEPELETYEVSTAVNSVRNNGPELVLPVAG